MLVHRADTGGYYEVDVTSDASVELLKEILAKLSGIPPNDQILLCDYVKLDRGQKLQRYGLPSQEKGVFLFDRRSLEPNSPLPGEVVFPQVEIQTYMQPAPPLPASDELKSSPLVWAIIKLEHEFFSDLNTAQALKQVIDARLNICKECVMEQENQTKALEAALANLRDQYSQLVQLYNQFKPSYNVLYDRHRSLLQSFESDLQKLRDTKLHSSLIRENQFSLIDIVPEGRLRKWAEDCRNEHEQLTQRVTDLENQVMIVKELVDSESRKKPEVDFKSLHVQLQKASDISQEVSGKVQLFVTDYQDVKRKKEQANKKDPKELADICEDLNDTKRKHQQVLQNMVKYDDTMKQIMSMCAASKTTLTRGMHERLRSSATLQSKIREYLNKVVVYHEALTKQRTAFQQLVYVQTMPKAYQAALDEVVRRRRFSRKISALNTKLMDYMNKLRQEEAEKRKIFLDSFGRFIPRELIPGLSEALPQFELVVPQFDASLPPIEPESNAPIEDDFTLLLSGEDKSSRVHDLEAENQKLQSEIKSLQWNLESSRNAFADLKDSELYRLKTDLLQSQESASDYKKRIEMLENKLSTTYSQIEQVENLMKEYKNKYEVAESEIGKLQKEASQLFTSQQTNQNLEQSLKETQEQVEQLMGKMKHVEDEKEALSNQLKEEEEERFKLYAEMKSLTKKLDLLKADYDDVMDQMKQLQKEKEDLLVIVETTSKDTEALLKEKSNVTQRQTELEEQITELEMLKDALEKERDNLAEEVEDQKSTIQQLKEELQDLENQIAVEKEDKRIQLEGSKQSNEQIAKLESKLGKLKLENRSIQQKLESTTQALSEAMDQIKQLNISLAERDEELSKTLESSTLDNKQHKKRADELSHKVKDLESQMEKDKRKMDDMQASVELYKARANKIEDEKRQLNDQLTTAHKNASKAEEEKVQLSRQLQSLSKIESEKKLLEKEKQTLLEELASSKEKLKVRDQELMEKIKVLEKQLVDLQKASGNGSGSNAALGELEKQLAERENSYRQLTQKYIDAVKIIESKNKQNLDIVRNATIQENKLKEALEKVTPLQVEMEKTKSVLQDVVNALPRDKTFKLDNNNWLASFQAGIRNLVEDYLKLDNEQNNIKGHLKAVELNHEHQLDEMKKKYQELQGELAVVQMEMENRDTKLNLAFNNFKAGDNAMFLPDKNGHYQAVNNKSPNYFLSPFVLEHFSDQSKEKAPIFGQIIEIQENTSSAQSNPFHLSHGTKYYEVVISKL